MAGIVCRPSAMARLPRASPAVLWMLAATLAVALATAVASAPPPSPAATLIPAACVATRSCTCVYPPGAPADAPDNACTIRKCVTCACSRGGACTSALVLTHVGAGDEVGNELPSAWGGPPANGGGSASATPTPRTVVAPNASPTASPTPTTSPSPSPSPSPAVVAPPAQGRGGGQVRGCLAPGTPCGFSPSAPACCGNRACVRDGPFRLCEE